MGIELAIEPEDLVHDSVLFVLQEMQQSGVVGRMLTEGWNLGDCIVAAISKRCAALARPGIEASANDTSKRYNRPQYAVGESG